MTSRPQWHDVQDMDITYVEELRVAKNAIHEIFTEDDKIGSLPCMDKLIYAHKDRFLRNLYAWGPDSDLSRQADDRPDTEKTGWPPKEFPNIPWPPLYEPPTTFLCDRFERCQRKITQNVYYPATLKAFKEKADLFFGSFLDRTAFYESQLQAMSIECYVSNLPIVKQRHENWVKCFLDKPPSVHARPRALACENRLDDLLMEIHILSDPDKVIAECRRLLDVYLQLSPDEQSRAGVVFFLAYQIMKAVRMWEHDAHTYPKNYRMTDQIDQLQKEAQACLGVSLESIEENPFLPRPGLSDVELDPPASSSTQKPAVKDTTQQTSQSASTQKPAVKDTTQQTSQSASTQKPAVKDTTQKPAVKDTTQQTSRPASSSAKKPKRPVSPMFNLPSQDSSPPNPPAKDTTKNTSAVRKRTQSTMASVPMKRQKIPEDGLLRAEQRNTNGNQMEAASTLLAYLIDIRDEPTQDGLEAIYNRASALAVAFATPDSQVFKLFIKEQLDFLKNKLGPPLPSVVKAATEASAKAIDKYVGLLDNDNLPLLGSPEFDNVEQEFKQFTDTFEQARDGLEQLAVFYKDSPLLFKDGKYTNQSSITYGRHTYDLSKAVYDPNTRKITGVTPSLTPKAEILILSRLVDENIMSLETVKKTIETAYDNMNDVKDRLEPRHKAMQVLVDVHHIQKGDFTGESEFATSTGRTVKPFQMFVDPESTLARVRQRLQEYQDLYNNASKTLYGSSAKLIDTTSLYNEFEQFLTLAHMEAKKYEKLYAWIRAYTPEP